MLLYIELELCFPTWKMLYIFIFLFKSADDREIHHTPLIMRAQHSVLDHRISKSDDIVIVKSPALSR